MDVISSEHKGTNVLDSSCFSLYTSLACDGNLLFAGSGLYTDYFQFGGLHIVDLDAFNHDDVCWMVDNLITFASFDACVSSIVPVSLNSNLNLNAAVLGLDDGSVQLITLKDTSSDFSHRKVFDIESLNVINSWSISSLNWATPNRGSFDPDMSMSNQTHSIVSTLNPLDSRQQISIWDMRKNSLTGPVLTESHVVDMSMISSTAFDVPLSLSWCMDNVLLVGTYLGRLLHFDVRNMSKCVNLLNVNDSTKCSSSTARNFTRQIVRIVSESDCQTPHISLLGYCGTINLLRWSDTKELELVYSHCSFSGNTPFVHSTSSCTFLSSANSKAVQCLTTQPVLVQNSNSCSKSPLCLHSTDLFSGQIRFFNL